MRGKRRILRPLWQVILADLLLTLLILGGWLMTRWFSVWRMAETYRREQLVAATAAPPATPGPAPAAVPEVTPSPTPETSAAPEKEAGPEPASDRPAVPEATPPPDREIPWQVKFASRFTPEVETGEGYYTSPNVSVHVTQHTYEGRKGTTVYYVADIYISSIECFRSYFAKGSAYPDTTDGMLNMGRESGAVVAVNGDFCGFSYGGTVLRNGRFLYSDITGSDVCLLYRDGTMVCQALRSFDIRSFGENELWQVWTFGPALLDGKGNPLREEEMNLYWSSWRENPRTALGYYEPGHYCFIVADGRDAGYSEGLWLDEFAEVCALTGCVQAYNMDGGASSMMYMDGGFVNRPSSGGRRGIPDILLIRDKDYLPAGEKEAGS